MSFQDSPITILAGEDLQPYRRVLFNGTNWMMADKNEVHHAITKEFIASGAVGAAATRTEDGILGIESATTLTAGNTAYAADDGKVSSTVDGLVVGIVAVAPIGSSNPAGIITLPGVKSAASFAYPATPVDSVFFIAPRAMRVRGVQLRPTVGAAGATAVVRKVPSGTAIASGTALHSGSLDLNGTANTNQTATLSTTASDLQLAAGDSLAMDVTGTTTNATGVVTVNLEDQ